jgi:hypothetical protein
VLFVDSYATVSSWRALAVGANSEVRLYPFSFLECFQSCGDGWWPLMMQTGWPVGAYKSCASIAAKDNQG